jgi:hypothetical protein
VIVLGIVLLIIGFIAKIAILWTLGIILLVVGAVLVLMGSMGRAVGGRATTTDPAAAGTRSPAGAAGPLAEPR